MNNASKMNNEYEQCVSLVDEWKCNPFDPENQNLGTLQTGAYASEELVNDFESPYEDGDTLVQDSVNTRLISKSKSLFDPCPKNNQKTFVNFKLPDFNKKPIYNQLQRENKKSVKNLRYCKKYIWNVLITPNLTKMRAQKWKNMKNRKAQTFVRAIPDVDSNFRRNERVMYYANVLINFQNAASRIFPINHGYEILNGLCMPMMHSKSPLLDELVKRVISCKAFHTVST